MAIEVVVITLLTKTIHPVPPPTACTCSTAPPPPSSTNLNGMAVFIKGDILSRKNIFCQYADIPGPLLATCTVKIKDRWKKVEAKGSASSKSNILYLLYTGTGRYTAQEPLNNCLCKRNVFETFVLT